jgi:hypothetical protein
MVPPAEESRPDDLQIMQEIREDRVRDSETLLAL